MHKYKLHSCQAWDLVTNLLSKLVISQLFVKLCENFSLNIWPLRANPEICQSTIYYAGLLGRWDKQIVDQESDVPSIIFLYFL